MKKTFIATAVGLMALSFGAQAADPAKINWGKVPSSTVHLFYPGQSTYQWLTSPAHKGAVKEVLRGDSCVSCHDESDAEEDLGASLVVANRLEPVPVKGKSGYKELKVQAAYDDKNAYLRFQWKTDAPHPGNAHLFLRYDGKEWKSYGGPKLDKAVQAGDMPAIYEDRLGLIIDDGKVAGFGNQGCWVSCHDGQRHTKGAATRDDAAANPLMAAIKKNDVRKYIMETRTDPMDWKSGKSLEEIAKLKADGVFLDMMQWRAYRSNPVGMADDGYVLEYRLSDSGKDVFASNLDSTTKLPKFMWDASKTKYKSITLPEVYKGNHYLVRESNTVPFDPNAGWKEGDMIPAVVVSRADASGSAADNNATGTWKDGVWTVILVRPLGLTNSDDKALKEGGVYNVGFSVHDDKITSRGHHISFVKTLGIGAPKGTKVDINAVKLK